MLNKEIPFLRIIIPVCLGIISGIYFTPGNLFFIVSGVAVAALFMFSLQLNRRMTNWLYGLAFFMALFLAGLFLYTYEKNRLTVLSDEEYLVAGVLKDFPEEKDKSRSMTLRMEGISVAGKWQEAYGSVLLYCRKSDSLPSLTPGDRLVVRMTPAEIERRGNPYEFDYRFYMENNHIRYSAFIDESRIMSHSIPERRRPVYTALIIRERIIGMFRERGIEGERLALVAAITLGQKSLLDPDQKQYFIKAGVMHIMAVSGLHAMILSMFIYNMLFFLKGRLNIIRIIVTIVTLWAFAFITGLTPSVLRAALMYSFLQAGNAMKRPVNGVNSVLASAFILILARPSVIFDAGFQLSYSAVIFIILFYRQLYLKIHFRHRFPDLVWQSAAVTITAQAGTLPLTVLLFNRFPTWFILSNIIIVPVSSIVVILGFLFPVLYPVVPVSRLFAHLLSFMTGLTEHLTQTASSLPLSSIENIGITPIESIFLTGTVFLLLKYILDRKSISVIYPAVSVLIFLSLVTVKEITTRRSAELIVYNSINTSSIGIRIGNNLMVYSDSLPPGKEVLRHAAVLNLRINGRNPGSAPLYLKSEGKGILVTNSLTSHILESAAPDIVILKGKKPSIERNIEYKGIIEAVIVCPDVNYDYRLRGAFGNLRTGKVHFIAREGAWYLRL